VEVVSSKSPPIAASSVGLAMRFSPVFEFHRCFSGVIHRLRLSIAEVS
jgi:hypothetical protein